LGEVSLPFSIGEYNSVVTGLVSEHVAEVILGINWLTDNRVIWEFHESRVRIGGVYYKLHRQADDGKWCRRVIAQNRVVIPARSESDGGKVRFHRSLISGAASIGGAADRRLDSVVDSEGAARNDVKSGDKAGNGIQGQGINKPSSWSLEGLKVMQRSSRAKPFVVHVNKLKKYFGQTPTSRFDGGSDHSCEEVPADRGTLEEPPKASTAPDLTTGGGDSQEEQDVTNDAGWPTPPSRRRRRP